MTSPSYPGCSVLLISNHAPFSAFSFRPLPAFSLSVTNPKAVPFSRVLSQMRLFSPRPLVLKDRSLDQFRPSVGGSY